ncbi:hypothetical protein IWX64_003185 [Arthrobacter sp. CAN_A212]|uniref:hypothetical protein n=1 Tax=Arthrobacter sp. CAN_A212 TaxID=2787719 RepID=UPI0018CB1559
MKAFKLSPAENIERTHLVGDPAQRLADQEATRRHLAHTVLTFLETCINAESICDPSTPLSPHTQRILSAAIRDLEDIDDHFAQSRAITDNKLPGTAPGLVDS